MTASTRCPKVVLALVLVSAAPIFLPAGLPLLSAANKVDEDKLYYGDARKYSRPAVVEAAKVYRQIPAHQELLDRKLTRDDPDYWPLMRKASQAFVRSLRKVCKDKNYDLVGEVKTISVDGAAPPDITSEVIKSLDKKDLSKVSPSPLAPSAPPRRKEPPSSPRPVEPRENSQLGADLPSQRLPPSFPPRGR